MNNNTSVMEVDKKSPNKKEQNKKRPRADSNATPTKPTSTTKVKGSPSPKKRKTSEDSQNNKITQAKNNNKDGKKGNHGNNKQNKKPKSPAKQEQNGKAKKLPGEREINPESQEKALQYLRGWRDDRSGFKFNKARDLWLLHHMFDKSAVNKNDFALLLEYFNSAAASRRKYLLAEAQKTIEEVGLIPKDAATGKRELSEKLDLQYKRSKKVSEIIKEADEGSAEDSE